MLLEDFPEDIRPHLIPAPQGRPVYRCLACAAEHPPDRLLYTCPSCGGLLMIEDLDFGRLSERGGAFWRRLFDHRLMLNSQAVQGIFAYHELIAPSLPPEDILYLGEGRTPLVAAPDHLAEKVGAPFYFKMDGQNPSASFKDRGMAAALSFLRHLARTRDLGPVVAVCASTGDTSAAAALYAAALGDSVKSAVLLPKGKVTPQQLSQPLGAGAAVFELPGVFDDCMRVVERLSEVCQVALLNSKNPWRVLGQESYAYEIAQRLDWRLSGKVLAVPVGNAGNITAILSGLLKLRRCGIVDSLPRILAVQSERANPVYLYYRARPGERRYAPVAVRPSVAQAAMIGDPVSFPRLAKLAGEYELAAGEGSFSVAQVSEREIMEAALLANRSGLPVCTQGGECLAGLMAGLANGLVDPKETAILDSTAHALKFADFQNAYFDGRLAADYGIETRPELVNRPRGLSLQNSPAPSPGAALSGQEMELFVKTAAAEIAQALGLGPA